MPAPAPLQRAARLGLKGAAALAFLAPLLTRFTMGHAFFLTGRGKLANFDNTVEFFASQNIPFPTLNAAFVSRLEYYGLDHGGGAADRARPVLRVLETDG